MPPWHCCQLPYAPLVSYMTFGSIYASVPFGVTIRVVIGFVLPSLSSYTYKIQNGMNLYNMGLPVAY